MAYIALYYPSIDIKSDEWLKVATLYWDCVGRIVRTPQRDRPLVNKLIDAGLVVNFTPTPEEERIASEPFMKVIDHHASVLNERYSVNRSEYPGTPWKSLPNEFPRPLLKRLIEIGVARPKPPPMGFIDDDFSLIIDRHIGELYRAILADEMARNRLLTPATDRTDAYLLSIRSTSQTLSDILLGDTQRARVSLTPDEVEERFAIMALNAILPADIEHVGVEKFIEVRRRYRDELTHFQTFLHGSVAEGGELYGLEQIQDPAALEAHISAVYERTIVPRLREVKRALNSVGIDALSGAVAVRTALPGAAGITATSLMHVPFGPVIAAGAGVAYGVTSAIRQGRKNARIEIKSSPSAYLLHVREAIGAASLAERIVNRARRATLGA